MLWNTAYEYIEHYNSERNHQGIGNKLIEPRDEVGKSSGDIQCNERLGGILKYYYRSEEQRTDDQRKAA